MDFILLTLGMVGFIVLLLVLLAARIRAAGPTRRLEADAPYETEAQLEIEDLQQMIEAQNEIPPPPRPPPT